LSANAQRTPGVEAGYFSIFFNPLAKRLLRRAAVFLWSKPFATA
jgi:hypothetical protein